MWIFFFIYEIRYFLNNVLTLIIFTIKFFMHTLKWSLCVQLYSSRKTKKLEESEDLSKCTWLPSWPQGMQIKKLFSIFSQIFTVKQIERERDRERIKEWKKEKIKIDNDDRMWVNVYVCVSVRVCVSLRVCECTISKN